MSRSRFQSQKSQYVLPCCIRRTLTTKTTASPCSATSMMLLPYKQRRQASKPHLLGLPRHNVRLQSMLSFRDWSPQQPLRQDSCRFMQIRDLPEISRCAPGNKLLETERLRILNVCNSPAFTSLPPNIIVSTFADRGIYITSGSTLCRM